MTLDEIIKMAREAGFNTNHEMIWINNWEVSPYMQRFAALVAAAERERLKAEVLAKIGGAL
jgi:uncharacterized protein (DUF1800 family)